MKKVAIIDYELGNLFSVRQACEAVGIESEITSKPNLIDDAHAIILPGVGAFRQAVDNLKRLDLYDSIKSNVKSGKPIFGICLGLQLLFSESSEFGETTGLELLDGRISRFNPGDGIRVPHVGWSHIEKKPNHGSHPLHLVQPDDWMYFVHSYFVVPNDEDVVLATAKYGPRNFCCSIMKDNIFATQFHPEKSGEKGLTVYAEWAKQLELI